MTGAEAIGNAVGIALLSALAVECILRLPFIPLVKAVIGANRKALRVIGSKRISDHWKEKVMLAYSGETLKASLKLAGLIFLVVAVLAVLATGIDRITGTFLAFIVSPLGLVASLVIAGIYAKARRFLFKPNTGFRSNYSVLDRLLHRLALQLTPVAEMSFDLDQARYGKTRAAGDIASQKHIFVCGLARAGTTILMRRFYETGAFRSLTYRDMPFVLAPNLWRSLSGASTKDAVAGERAHGDRLKVDVDSPESLDEVFWRVFSGDDYIRKDRLVPYDPDGETLEQYVHYVGAILAQEPAGTRYLSKDNNNVLRLGVLRKAFPNALILIPFRDPLQQAASLMNQHQRFVEMQAQDPFVRSYMTWLGHHEFGSDHRPFAFHDGDLERLCAHTPDTLDYWVAEWIGTYGFLLDTAIDHGAILVCYEDLCTNPAVWTALCALAALDAPAEPAGAFENAPRQISAACDADLEKTARDLYERLRNRSLEALPNGHLA